ncbi:MAG: H/ACA ribonucleoprotein complex subunit GAR1 [Candidatus Asgardarchaeia archaeon]
MRKTGKLLHVTSSGLIVVQSNQIPNIGDLVTDVNKKVLGIVSDICGPVNRPFVIVKPKQKRIDKLMRSLSKNIYFIERKRRRKGAPKK